MPHYQLAGVHKWLQPRPEVLCPMCTSVKATEISKDTEWNITRHSGTPVPGPQDNEEWQQPAGGPLF